MNLLRQIKEQFDWESYVTDHYDVKRTHGKNGDELRINCPSCGDTKFKCYVNPSKKAFYCFKCDFNISNKDLFDFVAVTESITRGTALMRLVMDFKPTTPEELDMEEPEPEDVQAPPVRYLTSLPKGCLPVVAADGDHFWEYLKDRGFTKEDLARTNVHCVYQTMSPVIDSEGKLRGNIGGRIVFPIYHNRQLCGWIARKTWTDDDRSPKYLNSPDTDLAKTVWPFVPPKSDHVVLVEGIIDALSVNRVEGVSAYACFGKKISLEQIQVLKAWGVKKVTLWFDKKDAMQQMISLVEDLKMYFDNVFVLRLDNLQDHEDAGYFLSISNGAAIIESTLSERISAYDEMEYPAWTLSF